MLKLNKKARVGIALVTVFFLWCQASQVMALPDTAQQMDCSNTIMCGVCAVALHSVPPELSTSFPEAGLPAVSFYNLPDPHPFSLYHPPR
jgi:hypothetical protein